MNITVEEFVNGLRECDALHLMINFWEDCDELALQFIHADLVAPKIREDMDDHSISAEICRQLPKLSGQSINGFLASEIYRISSLYNQCAQILDVELEEMGIDADMGDELCLVFISPILDRIEQIILTS